MRVFLTGATGYIGSAVFDALIRSHHHVDVLVRTSPAATALQARGAQAVRGSVLEPHTWIDAAARADGIVHAAAESGPRQRQFDDAVVTALTSLAPRPDRFIVYTSGAWAIGNTSQPADERVALNPTELVAWRPAHEQRILDTAASGVRAIVVRPGIVYGGGRGIVGDLLRDACNGLVRVIGPGENHWPLIYDRDLAELYARLVNNPTASGVYHANDEGDETVNTIVAALSDHSAIRPSVRHVPLPEARKKMGPYADALALDQIVRSPRARSLGWSPTLHSVSGNIARLLEEWRRSREAA